MKEVIKKLTMIQNIIQAADEYCWKDSVDLLDDNELLLNDFDLNWAFRQLDDVIGTLIRKDRNGYQDIHKCFKCKQDFTLPEVSFTDSGVFCDKCKTGGK